MERFTRRAALSTLAGVTLGSVVFGRASAEPTMLHVGTVPIFDVAPFYVADAQGLMAKENLAVTTEATTSGVVGIPALIGGSYDVVYSNSTSVLLAISKGLDLRIILETTNIGTKPPDPGAIITLKNANLKTGKDFEGKSLACNGLNNIQWAIEQQWVRVTGGDPSKVTFLELPLPAMVDAVKAHRVDGALVLDPFLTMAESDPTVEIAAWPFSKVFANGAPAFWVVTGTMANQRPEIVRAFVRAYRAGADWVNANMGKEAYFQLVAGYTKLDRKLIERMPLFPATSAISPRSLAVLNDLMVETGLLPKRINLGPYLFT